MSQLVPRGPASLDRLEDCDTNNMYSDWNRDEKAMLLPLDSLPHGFPHGLPSGVQTPTTPTLTPTTLRVIAAEILSLDDSDHNQTYHNEAGFVPPIVQSSASTYINMVDSKSWQGGSVTTMPTTVSSAPVSVAAAAPMSLVSLSGALGGAIPTATQGPTLSASPPAPTRRNVGGRRPTKAKGISPEEEERRQVRRERNKAAAARCRKRRMDHTNELLKETEGLEHKKQNLQLEIQELKSQVEELSFVLETHRVTGNCCLPRPDPCASPPDIKPFIYPLKKEEPEREQPAPAKRPMAAMPAPPVQTKPSRPTSLPVSSHTILRTSASEIAGISITTPSTGIPLNFDSLMDGGTGLTPVSGPLVPSCSSQQRNQNCADLSSPDSNIGNKLVSL